MPRLLIERSILKSRMNREVHVQFCEQQGVKIPLLTLRPGSCPHEPSPLRLKNLYIESKLLTLNMHDNDSSYKRKSFIEIGEIFFWTATINNWNHLLKGDKYKQVIIDSLANLSERELIDVFAFVIMPNHMHLIWRTNKMNGKETARVHF
jgi:hypothetical protein